LCFVPREDEAEPGGGRHGDVSRTASTIRFGAIVVGDRDVSMVATEIAGHRVRRSFVEGAGERRPSLAIIRTPPGRARPSRCSTRGRSASCGAGVIEPSSRKEKEKRRKKPKPISSASRRSCECRRQRAVRQASRDPVEARISRETPIRGPHELFEADSRPDLPGRPATKSLLGERHGRKRRTYTGGPRRYRWTKREIDNR